MTLEAAIRKAHLSFASQVYQISRPWHKRGIRTEFTQADHEATDWTVYYPESFVGYSGDE